MYPKTYLTYVHELFLLQGLVAPVIVLVLSSKDFDNYIILITKDFLDFQFGSVTDLIVVS